MRIPSQAEKWTLAAHEIGHAAVAVLDGDATPLRYVTIIPKSGALGESYGLPKLDEVMMSKKKVFGNIKAYLAGRISEIMWNGHSTTACSGDVKEANKLAYLSVKKFGFSDDLGRISIDDELDPGPELKNRIDSAAQKIISSCELEVSILLSKKEINEKWKKLVEELFEREFLDGEYVEKYFNEPLKEGKGVQSC